VQVRGKHLACTRYAKERGVQMTKCEVSVVLFALGISWAMGNWATICAPSGKAMNGRRCHDGGTGVGGDLVALEVAADDDTSACVSVVAVSERGG
jgi:hypothetical protein